MEMSDLDHFLALVADGIAWRKVVVMRHPRWRRLLFPRNEMIRRLKRSIATSTVFWHAGSLREGLV